MKQTSFLPKIDRLSFREFGGDLRKGKRKIARPFSQKLPLHVVFRSSHAKGDCSLLKLAHRKFIEAAIDRYARLYHIRIYRLQNVGNHLHVLLKTRTKSRDLARLELANFLRRFSGEVAMRITKAKKGSRFGRFWDELVYSRIVTWGREFNIIKSYFIKNLFEAHGVWNRKKFPTWRLMTIAADTS